MILTYLFSIKSPEPTNTNRFLCMDRCAFVCGFFETPLTVTGFVLVICSIYSQSDVSFILSQSHERVPTGMIYCVHDSSYTHFALSGAGFPRTELILPDKVETYRSCFNNNNNKNCVAEFPLAGNYRTMTGYG